MSTFQENQTEKVSRLFFLSCLRSVASFFQPWYRRTVFINLFNNLIRIRAKSYTVVNMADERIQFPFKTFLFFASFLLQYFSFLSFSFFFSSDGFLYFSNLLRGSTFNLLEMYLKSSCIVCRLKVFYLCLIDDEDEVMVEQYTRTRRANGVRKCSVTWRSSDVRLLTAKMAHFWHCFSQPEITKYLLNSRQWHWNGAIVALGWLQNVFIMTWPWRYCGILMTCIQLISDVFLTPYWHISDMIVAHYWCKNKIFCRKNDMFLTYFWRISFSNILNYYPYLSII